MYLVLGLFAVGLGVGYLLRHRYRWLPKIERLTSWVIMLMLFLLGVGVGKNPEVMQHLDTIGLRALWLSLGAMAGSVLGAWLLYHLGFKHWFRRSQSKKKGGEV